MFDVSVVGKRLATYLLIGAAVTGAMAGVTRAIELLFDLERASAVWAIFPMGLIVTLLISPIGQSLNDLVQRLILSRRRGCYDTLLELSKRMSVILHFDRLVDTVVAGLVRGIPVTHCALLIREPGGDRFVTAHVGTSTGETPTVSPIRADSPIVEWLSRTGRVLVKEEAKLNPEISVCFETVEDDLDQVRAALIVPLKIESKLIGILLLGEKLSGEIFDNQELDVLALLARQAAISLENARLYEELSASNAQLREASRLKSQFLASMSHELRTPLNSIIGFSKVLLNRLAGDLTEAQDTYLKSVHSSSTHLLQLINEILAFSRIEAGKEEIAPEDVELHGLIDECIDSSVALARGKAVKVEKSAPVDLPRVRADRLKVKQVLLNLLSNAVKFTESGRVVVRVQPGPEAMHVSVADTGIGMRAQDLDRLFQPFQQLDSQLARDANRKAGGTGLGLAISKKFVELHGGSIWAESREGQGSTFHFTLPLHEEIAAT
jgi:signal transduction histidine kinase